MYCDLDGCLVNFEKGVRALFRGGTSSVGKGVMWERISRAAPGWFERLEWTSDGKRLWNAIGCLNPDILTGVPPIHSSRIQKFNWCKRELGKSAGEEIDGEGEGGFHHVDMAGYGSDHHRSVNGNFPKKDKTNVITCWSCNKHRECRKEGS